jgi:hypothetical protein
MEMVTKNKASVSMAEKGKKQKAGAPIKDIKRELDIRVRLNATERYLLDTRAKKAGLKTSDWVRAALKRAKVVPRLGEEELGFLRTLAGMANNLNQLTKLAHTHGLLIVASKCMALLTAIDRTLKSINDDDRKDHDR